MMDVANLKINRVAKYRGRNIKVLKHLTVFKKDGQHYQHSFLLPPILMNFGKKTRVFTPNSTNK